MKHKTSKPTPEIETKPSPNHNTKLNTLLWLVLSYLFGYLHIYHIETLFENDKHFSHLSNLERELSFRTEMGLYYYYFKSLVVDQNLNPSNQSLASLTKKVILNDDRTEHPQTINSLQRFNLYPEIILAFFYRISNSLGFLKKMCWQVNRGDGMPPVESCEGSLEPIYFYSKSIFLLHGFSMAALFTLCWMINNKSLLSGIIGCVCYFYNHSEATRVMWSPALRESFSFPFHLVQLIALSYFIQSKTASKKALLFLTASTLVYLLPWQFAQFSLSTQTLALFLTFSLGFLSKEKLTSFIQTQTVALVLCFVLMFANRMLITSFFASLLCSIWLIVFVERFIAISAQSFLARLTKAALRLLILGLFTILFKKLVLEIVFQQQDDSHIWDILKSKFNSSYQTFDTRLYTCAREFDFLERETVEKLTSTYLLPGAGIIFVYYSLLMLKKFTMGQDKDYSEEDGLVLYNLFQLIAFTIMTALIMRLKLFWTPHLCVFASFLASNSPESMIESRLSKLSLKSWNRDKVKLGFVVFCVALMSYQGLDNIIKQHSIQGEYSNYEMEKMMVWIRGNTKRNEAFVGSMPTMANIKLSTNRPVVNHPHYEDVGIRGRTREIYSHVFGFRPVEELHSMLKNKYKASYLVLERQYCYSHPPGRKECAMFELAHLGMEKTSGYKACDLILMQDSKATKYFKRVFSEKLFNIFRVL